MLNYNCWQLVIFNIVNCCCCTCLTPKPVPRVAPPPSPSLPPPLLTHMLAGLCDLLVVAYFAAQAELLLLLWVRVCHDKIVFSIYFPLSLFSCLSPPLCRTLCKLKIINENCRKWFKCCHKTKHMKLARANACGICECIQLVIQP